LRRLFVSFAAALISACASRGSPTDVPRAPVETFTATSAKAAVAPEQATSGDKTADGRFAPPAGFHKRVHKGKTVYCKSETPVGTRFSQQYCFTEEELERIEANRRNVQREIDRARRGCIAGGDYCGGG